MRIRWSAPAVLMVAALFAVPGATAARVNPLDAQMTVGEPYTLPSQTVLVEEASGDIGFGTLTLNAPAGFEFDQGSKATATVADAKGLCNAATRCGSAFAPPRRRR